MGNASYCMLSPMPLESLFTHRLIRVLRWVLPVVVLVLIAIPSWNYWARQRQPRPVPHKLPPLPKDLSLRTDNFNFTKMEGDRTLFTIHAKENLGTSDNKNMLEDVDATIFGTKPGEPTRALKGNNCSYDQKTQNILCKGDVVLRLDENTTVNTDEAIYSHGDRRILINTHFTLERPGVLNGESNSLQYDLNSTLLNVAGHVKIHSNDGLELESESAIFNQKENRAIAETNVLMKTSTGWVRGMHARVDLTPETLQPLLLWVEGNVTSENVNAKTGETFRMKADSMEVQFADRLVSQVIARHNVELNKDARDGKVVLTGDEIIAHMSQKGEVQLVETKTKATMNFGDDRRLRSNAIWTDPTGSIMTQGESELQFGDSRIRGQSFSIQNGDILTFNTDSPAVLTTADQESAADKTELKFDSKTNELVSLTQAGHFTFKQQDREGAANIARSDSANVVTLEGAAGAPAWVSDAKSRVEAVTIRLDQNAKSLAAAKGVKSVSSDSGDRVLVTSDALNQTGDTITYTGRVHLYRGDVSIESDRLEAPVGAKVFKATATGHVFSTVNNMRVWADRLDYDDPTHVAHYAGNVRAQKQDIKITSADLNVNGREAPDGSVSVSDMTAKGQVVITRGVARGSGEQAVYNASTQRIVLTGPNSEVINGQGSTTKSPRITVNVAGDKMAVIEGSNDQKPVTTLKIK